jgi:adenylosuccinate synthase
MIDIVVGLQYGDEGKGKIVNSLANTNSYDFCIRYNGGANAGHTIYKNGKKIVTHQIPSGAVHNVNCIIGDNCYVDIEKLNNELKYLLENDVNITTLYVSKKAHLITGDHINKDSNESKIGTTKSGIGPCAISKYGRNGKRVGDLLTDMDIKFDKRIIICDVYEIMQTFYLTNKREPNILIEGAQGYGLDITHGEYPYVTSSHCISTDCLNIGIPIKNNLINIYGVSKCYETYVGAKNFQPKDNDILKRIQIIGEEKGATTGRDRQVNYLNIAVLTKSIWINNVTKVVINKYDVLKEVNTYKLYKSGLLVTFETFVEFKEYVNNYILEKIHWIKNEDIIWSNNKNDI